MKAISGCLIGMALTYWLLTLRGPVVRQHRAAIDLEWATTDDVLDELQRRGNMVVLVLANRLEDKINLVELDIRVAGCTSRSASAIAYCASMKLVGLSITEEEHE